MKIIKSVSKDFSPSQLPSNRLEVFFDVIKNRWSTLLSLGLLILVSVIPRFAAITITESITQQIEEAFSAKKIDEATQILQLKTIYSLEGILDIICFILISLSFSGSARIIKRLIWGEGISFMPDFFQGIKENASKMILLFAFSGAINSLSRIMPLYLESEISVSKTGNSFLYAIITGINFFILLPIGLFVFSQIAFYSNKIIPMIKNSVYFFGKTVFRTLLFIIMTVVPVRIIFTFVPDFFSYLLEVLLCLIFIPLGIMAWLLYSCSVFDKLVNARFYPEIVGKGIWKT